MITFIINPVAGKKDYKETISTIENFMDGRNIDFEIKLTKSPGHATRLAMEAVERGSEKVVAVGGDGTILEVSRGLAYKEAKLGIIPAGSGNDFVKTISLSTDINECLEVITGDSFIVADMIKVNEQYCLNISSIGIDAEIVRKSQSLKKIFGFASYFVSVFRNLFTYNSIEMRIKIDDELIEDKVTLIALANGRYYGGGFLVAPMAKIDDGLITVCFIRRMARIKTLFMFPFVIFGKHEILKEAKFYDAKKVEIFLKQNYALNVDGNLYDTNKYVLYTVAEKSIKVMR